MPFLIALRAFLASKPWIVVILVGLVLVAILGGLYRCSLDKAADDAVKLNDAQVTAEAQERVNAADRAVMANQQKAAVNIATQQQEVRHEAETKGNDDRVGAGVAAALDRVRQQQNAARRN